MPRPKLFRSSQFAYHVVCRSNNKEWFYIPLTQVWRILCDSLGAAAQRYRTEIHSCVLMSNHFHMMVSTPEKNLDAMMRYSLSIATYGIQNEAGRINHVFGSRYKWSILEDARGFGYVYKYVLRNPVRAGLCARVEDYRFSTLNDWNQMPILEGISPYWRSIPQHRTERLAWLNIPVEQKAEKLIALGLRRYRFQFSTSSGLQKSLRQLRSGYRVE